MTSVRHIYRITASVGRIIGIYMMEHYAKYVHIHNCTWTDSSTGVGKCPILGILDITL